MNWEPIDENLFLFRDALCNVYLLRDGASGVMFEVGSGAALDGLRALGVDKVDHLFLTHHHRDVAAAAGCFPGGTVFAPEGEARFLSGADDFWNAFKPYVRYDAAGEEYTPIRPVKVEPVMPGRSIRWRNWDIECHHTPGHTRHSFSYLLSSGEKRFAITGDLLSGRGVCWSIHNLAWDYMPPPSGAVAALESSIPLLEELAPRALLPSHGPPTYNPPAALSALRARLEDLVHLLKPNRTEPGRRNLQMHQILPHVYYLGGTSYLLVSDAGKGLIYDWGYMDTGVFDEVYERLGVEEIEVVSFSHFHDDHTLRFRELCYCDCRHYPGENPGSRYLRRPEVWVHSVLRDVLEHPWNHHLPCLWPDPIPVDRAIGFEEPVRWREHQLRFCHLPGQTWYHQGMVVDVDGRRVLFGGDSFWLPRADSDAPPNAPVIFRNIYHPGRGYPLVSECLEKYEPDLILPSHYDPIEVTDEYLDRYGVWAGSIRPVLESLAGPHRLILSTNPHWARTCPYHHVLEPGEYGEGHAIISNPLDRPAAVRAAFLAEGEWLEALRSGPPAGTEEYHLEPGETVSIPQEIRAPVSRGRSIILLEVWLDGIPQGAPYEMILETGGSRFAHSG